MHLVELRFARYLALAIVLATGAGFAALRDAPERGRVVVTDTETEILDIIEFAPGTAMLQATSFATLDAVAATLRGNPSITLVEVQSHSRGVGDESANLSLTERRAAVVVAYLENAGIEPGRLTAQGYGDTQPLAKPGSSKNERIAFLIVKRSSDE